MKPPAAGAEVESQTRRLNTLFLAGGVLFLLLASFFFFHLPWAKTLWPWTDERLTFTFLASLLTAVAATLLWIGITGEHGAVAGGAIHLTISAAGSALYLFWLFIERRQPAFFLLAFILILLFVINGWIFEWGRRRPLRDRSPLPPMLRTGLSASAILLLLVSCALILRLPFAFPWTLDPDSSVLFGLFFLGGAGYFAYTLRFPLCSVARGQLVGFLACDLVLIGPLLGHFTSVQPEHRLSLVIYTILMVVSGLLAAYFLFLHPATRIQLLQNRRQSSLAE